MAAYHTRVFGPIGTTTSQLCKQAVFQRRDNQGCAQFRYLVQDGQLWGPAVTVGPHSGIHTGVIKLLPEAHMGGGSFFFQNRANHDHFALSS